MGGDVCQFRGGVGDNRCKVDGVVDGNGAVVGCDGGGDGFAAK